MTRGSVRRRILERVLAALRQGLTPEKVALSIALGVVLGVTPVLGSTSALCLAAAALFGLNLPLIQLVNQLVYPLQLALLVPFIRLGEWLLAAEPSRLSLPQILGLVKDDVWAAIAALWTATLHALAAWLVAGFLASLVMYFFLVRLFRAWAAARGAEGA
jgi:hypothetical protein